MIVTLCGSSRFECLFKEWNLALTMAGHAVFTLTSFPSEHGGEKEWYTEEEKTAMDKAYEAKIRASDAVVVLNCGGYLGDSALSEVRYALSLGKKVFFLGSWGEGCGLEGTKSPISTVGFPSVWDDSLLGPAGSLRSKLVRRLETAYAADRHQIPAVGR